VSEATTSRVNVSSVRTAIIMAGALFLLAYEAFNLFFGGCSSSLVGESAAPSGALKASISVRACRAKHEFTTELSIIAATQSVPDSPNVLAVQASDGRATHWSFGGPEIRLTWVADTLLLVRYSPADRVIRSADRVRGVSIQHAALY
jgi:hypothetical protein